MTAMSDIQRRARLIDGRSIVLCFFNYKRLAQADVGPEVNQMAAQHHRVYLCFAIGRAIQVAAARSGSAIGLCPVWAAVREGFPLALWYLVKPS